MGHMEVAAYVLMVVVEYLCLFGLLHLVIFTRSTALFRIVVLLGIGALSATSRSFSDSGNWPSWSLPLALVVINAPLLWIVVKGLPNPDE